MQCLESAGETDRSPVGNARVVGLFNLQKLIGIGYELVRCHSRNGMVFATTSNTYCSQLEEKHEPTIPCPKPFSKIL